VDRDRRNVAVLAGCQALLLTNNVMMVAVNGLAGLALAPAAALATLPVTAFVVGAALTTMPASLYMRRAGRRAGFTLGTIAGMSGAAVCALAMYLHSFLLLCVGTLLIGGYHAIGQMYRFAASDAAPADFRSTAISLVLAGGIVGGIIGPETAKFTRELIPAHGFLGSYLALIGFAVLALLLVRRVDVPPLTAAEQADAGRPLPVIMRQPTFVVAVLCAMVGYGIMNLLMTATPIAMGICGLPYRDATFVLQWHVIGMFGPSFFTGSLIKRFGVVPVILAGIGLMLGCVAVALAGIAVANFAIALFLLGVGWNFMYIGGTTLLAASCTPSERAKTQGINEFLIFVTMAASSLSSGVMVTGAGWNTMNAGAVPFLVLTLVVVGWFVAARRRGTVPAR
jgi:MFS family permease